MPGLQTEEDNKKMICTEKHYDVPCGLKFIAQKELLSALGQVRERQFDSSFAKLRR